MEARMHAIMGARLRQGDVFQIIGDFVRTSIHSTLDSAYDNISNHVIEMCGNIESQIETSRGVEAGEVFRSHPWELERVRITLADARSISVGIQLMATPARQEAKRLGWIQ